MNDEQKWISVAQAAMRLDLSKRAVARWIRSGRLPSRLGLDGGREVSLDAIEAFHRDLFSDSVEDEAWACQEQEHETSAECFAEVGDAPKTPPREECAQETTAKDTTAKDTTAGWDPFSALEHHAERSIQVAGAAFQEAKELAVVYREELQTTRQEHQRELRRVRRHGQAAWWVVAASVLIVIGGVWWLGRQESKQQLAQTQVSHLTERLGRTASEKHQLQTAVETLQKDTTDIASELHSAKLGQVDAVGQLAAYRAHADQLVRRVRTLETQLDVERQKGSHAVKEAKQRAVAAERKRLARIRQAKAELAERQRQTMTAQARAERERVQREERERQKRLQAEREGQAQRKQEKQRQATLAKAETPQRSYRRTRDTANLTLSELERVLTRNSR